MPEVCLDPALLARPTSTPPRGRNRTNSKRKRSPSRSSDQVDDQQPNKNPRLPAQQENEQEKKDDKSEESIDDKTDDVDSENLATVKAKDAGQFTEHISYSPARPAPPKHSMITTTPGHLTKLKQPKLTYKPLQQPSKPKMDFQ